MLAVRAAARAGEDGRELCGRCLGVGGDLQRCDGQMVGMQLFEGATPVGMQHLLPAQASSAIWPPQHNNWRVLDGSAHHYLPKGPARCCLPCELVAAGASCRAPGLRARSSLAKEEWTRPLMRGQVGQAGGCIGGPAALLPCMGVIPFCLS